jgi:hypothetical protein
MPKARVLLTFLSQVNLFFFGLLRATALFPQHHEDVSFGLQRAQKASLRPTFAVR